MLALTDSQLALLCVGATHIPVHARRAMGSSQPAGRAARPAEMLRARHGMWTLAFGYGERPHANSRYEATREAAMAAFAKSRRRE